MEVKIAPSILSADFSKLGEEIVAVDKAGADFIHLDVMDGNFVPNITFGSQLIKSLRGFSKKIFDTHLMINNPEMFINDFADAGSDIITIHLEACVHAQRSLTAIKNLGVKAGISIVPSTNEEAIRYLIEDVDLILVMSVNPGFGGQKFIPSSLRKIKALQKIIDESGRDIILQVDGGVNGDNASEIIESGADCLVAGSWIFSAEKENYADRINQLRKI